nr:cytochrome p450 87a3 [Quercus suber]
MQAWKNISPAGKLIAVLTSSFFLHILRCLLQRTWQWKVGGYASVFEKYQEKAGSFMIMLLWLVGSWVLAVIVAWFVHWIYKWYNPTCKGVLPPTSMGLPLIGETFQLLEGGYSLDMIPFMKKRIQRYGLIFKTSVAGRPIIVSADPNFNH